MELPVAEYKIGSEKNISNKQSERNSALDVIRGIAILLVMISHCLIIDKQLVANSVFKYFRLLLCSIYVGGWSGVDLFFVLSGFLVSGLLFNEYQKKQKIQAGRFLIRRSFKIYPSFIFFILVTFFIERVLNFTVAQDSFNVTDYLKDLFFIHNYFGGRWIITWSLDVEEIFYFLLAAFFVICIAYKKLNFKTIVTTYIILLLWGIANRYVLNKMHPAYSFEIHYIYSHIRLDALFFGVLLSYIYWFKKSEFTSFIKKNNRVIILVSLLLVIPNYIFQREKNNWISVILLGTNPICYGLLMMVAIESKHKFFKNKLLSVIGKNSYAIYLWHAFINGYIIKYLYTDPSIKNYLIYLTVFITVSIVFGICVTAIIETPFLKLRNKLFPDKNKIPVTQ